MSSPEEQQLAAADEFERLAQALRNAGINVITVDDTQEPHTPDAIFPNNWVSFHADGSVVLYPMEAPNRRTERRLDVIHHLADNHGFKVSDIIDLSHHEGIGQYLEGTGSLVLDRSNRIAYACLSSRTHLASLDDFAQRMGYEALAFDAVDRNGAAIYHTNVLMNVGENLAVICTEAISRKDQRDTVVHRLKDSGHEIIDISFDQMDSFAGNMLELRSNSGEHVIAMSRRAHNVLTATQLDALSNYAHIVSTPIDSIEDSSGGSVRCMLAEIHLPITAK
jgi:hypothetical protein